MKKKGKRKKTVKKASEPKVTPEVINPPEVVKESLTTPTKYQIVRSFSVNSVMYNLGEEVPEISQAEIDMLFETGRIAKVIDGKLVSKVNKPRFSPARLQALSKSAYPIIRGFLLNSLICTEDMEELLKLCIEQNRPPVILNNISLVIEQRKLEEEPEEPHIDIETEVCPEPASPANDILNSPPESGSNANTNS